MKIAFLSQEVPSINDRGGIGFHFWILAQELTALGHDVTIFFDGNEQKVRQRVTLYGVWGPHSTFFQSIARSHEVIGTLMWSIFAVRAVRTLQQNHQFDIIEFPEYHSTPILFYLDKKTLVMSCHGGKKQTASLNTTFRGLSMHFLAFLEALTIKNTSYLYAVSQQQRSYIQKEYGVNVPMVAPNPVDTALFHPVQKRSSKDPYFLFVGRIEHRKGIGMLLDAYVDIAKADPGKIPDLICIGEDYYHLGPEKNLSFEEYIQRFVPTLVAAKIHHLPQVPQKELVPYYQHAVACVFPAIEEPFGNVIAEALSCGAVVLVSTNSGAVEWLTDQRNAICFEPTSEALKLALQSVVEKSPSVHRKKTGGTQALKSIRSAAREIAVKHFSPKVVTRAVLKYYTAIHSP